MESLSMMTLVGAWVSIFLTICVLSFLYDDNPVYKFAEHLFLGVSVGISITEIWYGVFQPNLADKLMPGSSLPSMTDVMFLTMAASVLVLTFADTRPKDGSAKENPLRIVLLSFVGLAVVSVLGQFLMEWVESSRTEPWNFQRTLSFFPLVLTGMLFMKLNRKHSYLARVPIAFIVAAYAGVKLTGEANANLMTQVAETMPSLVTSWHEHGFWNWDKDGAGVFSDIFLVVGLASCLIYFYFSAPMKGGLAWVSRFGILVLMLSFGASFGYTVMGRISLAIGRAQEMLGLDRAPEEVAQIHPRVASLVSLVLIVALLAAWRKMSDPEDQTA
jgi:hypothetical protein